jgi:hypothetical protein
MARVIAGARTIRNRKFVEQTVVRHLLAPSREMLAGRRRIRDDVGESAKRMQFFFLGPGTTTTARRFLLLVVGNTAGIRTSFPFHS